MTINHNVLDAWITIEQLSEGTISRKDKTYDLLYNPSSNWKGFLLDYIYTKKSKTQLSDKQFLKSGIVMYFGIFDFEEVVEILRKKYKIEKTDEEIAKSEKFTIALYFNHKMEFLGEYLFLTISGYIRNKGDLPEDLRKVEAEFNEILSRRFDKDFNATFNELYTRYNVTPDNFRFKYLTDLENGAVNLHSFFIEDLKRAKKLNNNNLNQYINGFFGTKYNLDSHKNSENFNPAIFEEAILQPKHYPLGRFPSNTSFALSFMQQAAVNIALNDENKIVSVNGPPGTGKTTLLKDIFADLIVQQAADVVFSSKKTIEPTIVYFKAAKFGPLPTSMANKNIIVASSNNGAVQNIVNELPKIQEIDNAFIDAIQKADYFTYISNCRFEEKFTNNTFEIKATFKGQENWGAFSLEGGKAENMKHLKLTIESIIKELKEDYTPQPNVYEQFKELYQKVTNERQKKQQLCEKFYRLRSLKVELAQKEQQFIVDEQQKKQELHVYLTELLKESSMLEETITELSKEQQAYMQQLNELDSTCKQAERNFDVIQAQRPSFIWLQKIFFKKKIDLYFKGLNDANEQLQQIITTRGDLLTLKNKNEDSLSTTKSKLQKLVKDKQEKTDVFDKWLSGEREKIKRIQQQMQILERELTRYNIKGISFDESYEQLQKSNPWFTEDYRSQQTQLFIAALKVRKQFLYDNFKNLQAAVIIWNKKAEYIGRLSGEIIMKEAWQWINFAIPVISTTFASFGRMFNVLHENSLGHLFIDEAGQALPQASVGAIFRSKKA
ncbi:MAG: AAA domain-containing protein, partial [Lysinibacillus sp.]